MKAQPIEIGFSSLVDAAARELYDSKDPSAIAHCVIGLEESLGSALRLASAAVNGLGASEFRCRLDAYPELQRCLKAPLEPFGFALLQSLLTIVI